MQKNRKILSFLLIITILFALTNALCVFAATDSISIDGITAVINDSTKTATAYTTCGLTTATLTDISTLKIGNETATSAN